MKSNLKKAFFAASLTALFTAAHAFAQGQSENYVPVGIEAHPPLRVRPFASTSPVGYAPSQIRNAYGIDLVSTTQVTSPPVIAIVDAYGSPTAQSDLDTFCTAFGIEKTTIQIIYGSKKPGRTDAGWALETALDLQWAHALAPKAKLILAVGFSASLNDLLSAVDAAVKAGASVVSMSWGASEFSSEASASINNHFVKPGVTFLASSGDNGAGVSWPAASPNVVSVGGTTLYLSSTGSPSSETAWSGSGGGYSAYFGRPSYQNSWNVASTQRAIPDVSMVADPNTGVAVYTSTAYNGQKGWFQVGGTSASAPMWAAIVALANQQRIANGLSTLSGGNNVLYQLASSVSATGVPQYSNYFLDITAGSNGFPATTNYDPVTGLGTPVAPNVVTGLSK